ncbi:heparanase-like [Limulus polyphemus]|uniref:Heparanase-like n=1 Tax=Limulus polyphemus TaxID=6850 RepID=A0ABM1BJN7_LIMPO|nr:heparanase-like [Limulus polyphemus]
MDWKKLNWFAKKVGWKLIFDLNALTRNIHDEWDPGNSLQLFRFNEKMGFSVDWELGNELNAHHRLHGSQLGKDFLTLRKILNTFFTTNSSLLVGPDVTQPSHRSSRQFLKTFLKKANSVVDAVTFHQYYCNGKTATLKDFLDIDLMDSLGEEISTVKEIVKETGPAQSIWLGESGSAWGGGAPGLSDTYIAGFLWLDKLGLSAARGLDVVLRQSFYNGHYGMITSDLHPLPDFWLSVLYKWLVGRRVLRVDVMQKERKLRVYAHCTKLGRIYKTPGAVTLLVINVYNVTAKLILKLDTRMESPIDAYLLTPIGSYGLQSKNVALNGKLLKMVREDKLPHFLPKRLPPNSPIEIPPLSYGLYVLPLLNGTACIN